MPPSQRRSPNRSSFGLISMFSVTSCVSPLLNLPPIERRALRWMTWRKGLTSARTSGELKSVRKRSRPAILSAVTLLTRLMMRWSAAAAGRLGVGVAPISGFACIALGRSRGRRPATMNNGRGYADWQSPRLSGNQLFCLRLRNPSPLPPPITRQVRTRAVPRCWHAWSAPRSGVPRGQPPTPYWRPHGAVRLAALRRCCGRGNPSWRASWTPR